MFANRDIQPCESQSWKRRERDLGDLYDFLVSAGVKMTHLVG